MKQKLFTLLTLLVLCVTGVWADTSLVDVDFSSWESSSVSAGNTVNGIYFKSATTITKETGVVFGGNASTSQNFIAIPVSGINGSITITITYPEARPQWKCYFSALDAAATSSDLSKNPSNMSDNYRPGVNTTTSSWTITGLSKGYGVFYIGAGSNNSNRKLASIKITTPAGDISSTIGLQQVATGSVLATPSYTQITNLTVTKTKGSKCDEAQSNKTVYGPSSSYTAAQTFRKTENTSTWSDNQWAGYNVVVPAGYKMSLTNLNAALWCASDGADITWRVLVENASGTALYTSDETTSLASANGGKSITVAAPTGVANLQAGTYTVKLQVYQAGGNKYFAIPYLTFNASVEEDLSTTYTVNASAGAGGSVSPSGDQNVIEGGNISITATPNTGYDFVSWTVDGADGGTTNPLTLTNVTAPHTVVANFKQLYSITLNVASENKGTSTVGFATQYANASDKWTPATNYYVAKEGYTLTKWNDGTNDYVPGTEYTLAGNITIEPVFTANTAGIGDLTEEKTVTWTFARSAGAPNLASEGNTQYYVQQTTIAGNTVDVPIFVNTESNYGIDGKKGKFNNGGNEGYAQVNAGTVFKIPAAKGMVVKYMTNQTTAVGNIGFTDDTDDLGGDGSALTSPTDISSDNKTISYTYTGTEDYLYLVDKAGGKYPTGISVTYPEVQTKYLAPTITVGDFSFEDKGYKVTITATEGTLQVSTDGTNYTEQTSPYQVNVTSTTHFYAKATGTAFDPSDVTEETVTNTFDATKSYVAWVYESNYKNAPNNYAVANDEIYKGLVAEYNVVLVDIKDYNSAITDEQKAALNGNLDDADLVVLSEAAAGGSKAVIAMKDLVGTVPMLNMKLFAYTYSETESKNRWGWGSPQNLGKAVANVTITPVSKYYKVLENVTFDGDNVPLFAYPNEQNHIQYVDSWANEPTGDVVLANVTVSETSKPAMHASTTQKYFALGISCDDFGKYNDNVITIIKNAAAMLIAGEDLAAVTTIEKTIPANKEWITFCSTANLDFSSDIAGLEGAYTITAHADKATALTATKMTGKVKAGTGLLLRAAAVDATNPQVITIPVAATGEEQADNMLKGVIVDTEVQPTEGTNTNLGLSNGEFHPYSAAGTLAAGKAYLQIPTAQMPTGGNNARLYIVLDGEATGINTIENSELRIENSDAPMYNLAGQRVTKSYKGVVIVNGKKYINK